MQVMLYYFNRLALGLLLTSLTQLVLAQGSVTTTTQSFSYSGQIVTWQVPTGVTSLTIEARGAEGIANRNSGRGAVLRGTVSVTPAQTLSVLVGGQPTGNGGLGGGGGSFVVTMLSNTLRPLLIAGGGGGGGNLSTDSPAKHGQAGQAGGAATNSGGAGGTAGSGGRAGTGQYAAAGGGGLLTDGESKGGFPGGKAFVNGGQGGGQGNVNFNGGFGGGGSGLVLFGNTGTSLAGGGGGGYSGGGGASANGDGSGGGYGGGGGSYNLDPTGSALTGATNGNSGNGLVTISYVLPCNPFTVNLRNDGPLTCIKKSVTLTTTDGPTGASYTYSPGAQVSSTSSATATVTNEGPYSVTVTVSGGCSATATTTVQSNTVAPGAPTLVTQSGFPYPAGVNTLTLSQNVGPVSLTASGCSDGQLSTSAGSASSFTISTAMTGTQTYTATCTSNSNGCTSPAGSFQLTVVPTTLSVQHRDADFGNTQNNIIKPFLQLANAGGQAIPYGEVTVRYWFTSEGQAPPTNLAVYYAQLGAVNLRYVPLSQPRQGAFGYVEYSFPGGGSLNGGGNSGPIENGIQKTDGSNFNESDDYSYQANYPDYVPNSRITAYRNGTIVWGQEPTAVTSVTAVQVYTQARDQPTTSQIQTRLELRNTGNRAIPVQDLRIRYYFTSDNNQPASVFVDYADIGTANIQARVIKLPAPVGGADSYVELRTVPNSQSLAASSSLGAIDFRLVRSDNGLFDQSNDYSYLPNYGNAGLNNRVTVLLNNRLIFGTPPNGAPARVMASEPVAPLSVKVLGNPVVGSSAQVEISGVAGQALTLRLIDLQGRAIHEQRVEQTSETEQVSLPLGTSRGTLLLKVHTDSQQQSVKLLRP